MTNIFLASASPRRKELLELIGYEFSIKVANIDETIDPNLNLDSELLRLSRDKANAIKVSDDDIVIAADTIVTINGRILGKPKDHNDAYEMLKVLNNNSHQVITSVCIKKGIEMYNFLDSATIKFKNADQNDLLAYANSDEPLDKAGAYAIQGKASIFIDSIIGDYYTIVGLPVSKVHTILKGLLR